MQLPPLAAADTNGVRLDYVILAAVQRILNWADDWKNGPAPVFINLSYMIQAGPKNGSGFLERRIRRLIDLRNDAGVATKLVMPMGNGYRARSRGVRQLGGGDEFAVLWRVLPGDQSSNFLEIWYDDSDQIEVTVKTPDGEDWGVDCTPDATTEIRRNGKIAGQSFCSNHLQLGNVTLALAPTIFHDRPEQVAPAGAYRITVKNAGSLTMSVDVEVQRDASQRNYREIG